MIINRSFKDFKFRHRSKKNQIIYTSKKVNSDDEVINLIDNFLEEKNSFICLLYTSPSPRDVEESRMPSSA